MMRQLKFLIFPLFLLLFSAGIFFTSPNDAFASCTAEFTKEATEPANFISSSDEERYDPNNPPAYQVDIEFTDCVDELVRVVLKDQGWIQRDAFIDESEYSINITESPMTAQITWLLGDNDCDGPAYADDECDIFPFALIPGALNDKKGNVIETYKCWKNADGKRPCRNKFKPQKGTLLDSDGNPIPLPIDVSATEYLKQIVASPCYEADPDGDGDSSDAHLRDNCIGLLAPLPGIDYIDFEDEGNPLGKWINIILQFAIGIAGLLGVVMIIITGIRYMTTDLVTSKQLAKEQITNSIIGLLIILGIFIILNTINPNLTLILDPTQRLEQAIFYSPEYEPATPIGNFLSGQTYPTYDDLKDASGNTISIQACNPSVMSSVSLMGHTVQVHQSLVPSIQRINTAWQNKPAPLAPYTIKNNEIGGYNCRTIKNINGQDTGKYSAHAYGLAIDINYSTNPHGPNLITDMPAWFVQIWDDEGWGWGGNWGSSKDAMHFSFCPRNEGGDCQLK